jgi:hypothetical protein
MPRVHRNLHSLKKGSKSLPWSYYQTSGEKVRGAYALMLENVTPKNPSGQAALACLNGTGHRAVFAWLRCERLTVYKDFSLAGKSKLARLSLDPTSRGRDRFFHVNGREYTGSARVYLCPDGSAYTSTENIKND